MPDIQKATLPSRGALTVKSNWIKIRGLLINLNTVERVSMDPKGEYRYLTIKYVDDTYTNVKLEENEALRFFESIKNITEAVELS